MLQVTSIRRILQPSILCSCLLLPGCYFVGPSDADTREARVLWDQDDERLKEELGLLLMERVERRRIDNNGALILIGKARPTCDKQLQAAGLKYVGDVRDQRFYRSDQWSPALIMNRNIIVGCGPHRVRVDVGYTGL